MTAEEEKSLLEAVKVMSKNKDKGDKGEKGDRGAGSLTALVAPILAVMLGGGAVGGVSWSSSKSLEAKLDQVIAEQSKIALNVNTLMAAGTDGRLKELESRMRADEERSAESRATSRALGERIDRLEKAERK